MGKNTEDFSEFFRLIKKTASKMFQATLHYTLSI